MTAAPSAFNVTLSAASPLFVCVGDALQQYQGLAHEICSYLPQRDGNVTQVSVSHDYGSTFSCQRRAGMRPTQAALSGPSLARSSQAMGHLFVGRNFPGRRCQLPFRVCRAACQSLPIDQDSRRRGDLLVPDKRGRRV